MEALLKELLQIPELQELAQNVERGDCPAVLTGTAPVHRSQAAAALSRATGRPLVFLCHDEAEARRTVEDLRSLLAVRPRLLTAREWQLRSSAAASHDFQRSRLAVLYDLATENCPVLVATAESLLQRTLPPDVLAHSAMTLQLGRRVEVNSLPQRLVAAGYSRCQQVEGPGQFALRGGILDLFSPNMDNPVRCEFFDDEVDAMGVFDVSSQRRIRNVESALLLPVLEALPQMAPGGLAGLAESVEKLCTRYRKRKNSDTICQTLTQDAALLREGLCPTPDRYLPLIYPDFCTALDYLPPDALICVGESSRFAETVKNRLWQWQQDCQVLMEGGLLSDIGAELMLEENQLYTQLADFPLCFMDALPVSSYPLPPKSILQISARQLSSYGGSLEAAASDLESYQRSGSRVLVLCSSEGRAKNLQRLLQERGISAALDFQLTHLPGKGQVRISTGAFSAGAEYQALNLAILTEGQLTASFRKASKPQKGEKSKQQKLQSFTDLSPGDLVVHVQHGVGRFVAIQRMPVDGVEKDYIKIAYAGNDCLYVPATQLNLVSKYIGGGEDIERTRLHKLGGSEWNRSKSKAKAAAKDLAQGLIQLYAQRQRQSGYAFSPDSPWQLEFEESFPYAETDDQLKCIAEIKKDMERPVPMDRLLCGDVGYGKTEVAFRAIMKCVLDGKQAAILVPTTVLAQQHYATAVSRFRSFPINVAVLSRFQSAKQSKQILEDVKNGRVDLLIGTHRLLQKGLQFKDLGLLVVDEEQRFGVSHKEKLKEFTSQVDVLTLSATPIPRTLNMALSGIRDLSMLEEPPHNRQPVQTYVLEHDWSILMDAMRREIARGGQVYYLHNHVESIERTALRIQQMLGEEVNVVVGHGKMGENELSHVMQQMVDGEAQVLVCTTIIETGIDIPNVNTLIIENADRMGLAQLHQLRGRIGRSSRRAYAYMTFRPGKALTDVAEKRLTAIRDYVEFGSGFKIAMRDLEIRGAGNLLGPEQSGYLMSVGYDMYLQLLEEAVLEEKGEEKPLRTDCAADLTVSANIPEYYVASAEQRMDLYRRIAAVETGEDAEDILDEMLDRYGEAPKAVLALLDVALLRAAASRAGVSDISQKGRELLFTLARFEPESLVSLCTLPKYKQRILLGAGEIPRLTLYLRKGEDPLQAALELVEDLKLKMESAGTKED